MKLNIERPKNKFSSVSNVITHDETISIKAKGVYFVIMSLPESWDFSVAGLCKIVKEGRDCIYSALNELKASGYCTSEQIRDKGKIVGTTWRFKHEPDTEKPYTEKPDTVKPDVDEPDTEKPTQSNNKESNIQVIKYPSNQVLNKEVQNQDFAAPSEFEPCVETLDVQTLKEKNAANPRKGGGGVKNTRTKFEPPTEQDVSFQMQDKGLAPDAANHEARKFINYYGSVGWTVGKSGKVMKSWKHAVSGWVDRISEFGVQRPHQSNSTGLAVYQNQAGQENPPMGRLEGYNLVMQQAALKTGEYF